MLGPGNGNIHPPLISDKSNISPVIISYTVEDNDVSLLALEGVHCVDVVFKLRNKLFQQVYLSLFKSTQCYVRCESQGMLFFGKLFAK